MNRWIGRVAIVTGASSGIGAAIARLLAQNGMTVVGVARREERLQELAQMLKAEGAKGEIFPLKGDVTCEEDVKRVVQWARKNSGGVDVLVNNAGVAPECDLTNFDTENLRKTFDTNVIGLALFSREAIRDMKARGINDGHIFNINSLAGHSVIEMPRNVYAYSASKHAVTAMTEGLRRELRDLKKNFRITSISPGLVRTEIAVAAGVPPELANGLYELHPSLDPKDVADALVYALKTPPNVQIHEITINPVGGTF